MKLNKKCSHPECNNILSTVNKSRFCKIHRDYSTIRRFRRIKDGAKKRNLPVNLTFQKYLDIIKQGCYYCGKDLMLMIGTGLDRINNELGYSSKNSIPCCPTCNDIRGRHFTVEEFKKLVDFVFKLRKTNKWPEYISTLKTKRRARYGV